MFILDGNIEIGKYRFKAIHGVEITKSVEDLADTAVIKLPSRFRVKQNGTQQYTEQALKVGDKVMVTLGYEDFYEGVEFKGFVKKISPKIPLEIHCEDNIWLLRRKNITKAWNTGATLEEILNEVVAGTSVKLADNLPKLEFEKFIIKNANGAQVLQKLKEDYALSVFIQDDGRLYAGLQQATNIGEKVNYDLDYNLVENNLEFKSAEERKIKVRYTYIDKENNQKSIEVGDVDGELRTFFTSVISDVAKLKEMAQAEIDKMKYDGYDGNIKTFLIPYATRGMKASLTNREFKHRSGDYFIKKLVLTFDTGGARRNLSLGQRL